MAKIQQIRFEDLEEIYPITTLDAIKLDPSHPTISIASGGVIQADYLDLSGTVNSAYLSSANVIPASAINGFETAAKNAASTYVHSANVVPTSAVNGLSTAITNGASTYVHSAEVIPGSAVSNLATSATNAASTYVNSASVIPQSAVVSLTTDLSGKIGSAYVSSANIIPMSAVSGLSTALNGKIDAASYESTIQLGFGMEWNNDNEISMAKYRNITSVTGASVSLNPGEAYVIDATASSKTINYGGSNTTGKFGLESHIELFVANEGYVHTGSNVTLVDPLEPDAVNNLTVRFHDGHAILSVEDHAEAYMVNNTGTGNTTSGTFAYGLKQVPSTGELPIYNYIGFRSELNTSSIPTGGQSATVMKHIVGNGMTLGPTITGNLIIESGATIRDIKANGLVVMSGNATLTDVFIDSGATVSIGAGGGLTPVRVYGNGGVIDMGGTVIGAPGGASFVIQSCIVRNGSGAYGGIQTNGGSIELSGCTVSNMTPTGIYLYENNPGTLHVTSSLITNAVSQHGISFGYRADVIISGSTINSPVGQYNFNVFCGAYSGLPSSFIVKDSIIGKMGINAPVTFEGSNTIGSIIGNANGVTKIMNGAIIDLTGNSTASPIATSGGVVVSGGCTVINSAGVSVHINGGTYTKINNDGTTA